MNNFSDLQAIDRLLKLTIKLGVIHDNGYPGATIRVNDDVVEYLCLKHDVEHEFYVDVLDPMVIEITMIGKQYSENKETAVLIQSVNIDNFEIVPKWTHLAEYHGEGKAQEPTSYLGFNGTWRLSIDLPFYQWRHHATGQGWLLEPI